MGPRRRNSCRRPWQTDLAVLCFPSACWSFMAGPSLPGIWRRNNKPLLVVCWVCGMVGKADPEPTHPMICAQSCRHRWDCTAAPWRGSEAHSGSIWSSGLDSPTLPCTTAPPDPHISLQHPAGCRGRQDFITVSCAPSSNPHTSQHHSSLRRLSNLQSLRENFTTDALHHFATFIPSIMAQELH